MTLDIEKERLEFEAWYVKNHDVADLSRKTDAYLDWDVDLQWNSWLAAKRAAVGSAEPFTYYKEPHDGWPEYSTENEFSDGKGGGLALYTAPPAPVSAEPVKEPKPPKWYTRDEIVNILVLMNYSDLIAQELADWMVLQLTYAFNKGFQVRGWDDYKAATPTTDAKESLDAARYRWLRDGNSYAPEEEQVHGYDALDELCDSGIATKERP